MGALEFMAPLKLKKAYKVSLNEEEEAPQLLPAVGSDSKKGRLVCPKINISPREQPDGSYRFSHVEWLVDISGFPRPVTQLQVWATFLEFIDLCQAPVSLYGKTAGSGSWQRLEIDDSGSQDGMEEFDDEEDWTEDEARLLKMLESGDDSSADDILSKLKNMNRMRSGTDAMDCDCGEGECNECDDEDIEDMEYEEDDDEEIFDQLCLGIPLVCDARHNDNQNEILDECDLKTFVKTIKQRAKELHADTVQPRTSIKEGAARALQMADVIPLCEQEMSLILRADEGSLFNFMTVWDCLLSLGMEYESDAREFVYSGPVFNCHSSENIGVSQKDAGRVGVVSCKSERLIFVSMTDENGKSFFPESNTPENAIKEIKFGFYVPYCPEPLKVLNLIIKAMGYCWGRLGGALIDEAGEDIEVGATCFSSVHSVGIAEPRTGEKIYLNLISYEERLQSICDQLARGGLQPGEPLMYNLF